MRDNPPSWRKCLADGYEAEHGPLPDPVATSGSELVTAPPTPVLSSSIAGPDASFIEQLQSRLSLLRDSRLPESVAVKPEPVTHESSSHLADLSSSDTDDGDDRPWSLKAYASFLFAGRKGMVRDYDNSKLRPSKQPIKIRHHLGVSPWKGKLLDAGSKRRLDDDSDEEDNLPVSKRTRRVYRPRRQRTQT
ncbi:hypothetical protein HJFPF1_08275 [Paramyrothecium foliicola]|nr:hypothetical protein HJFPF1_08275 [Paramyrothecium foliicola]